MDKKQLYNRIMEKVAIQVKNALNEDYTDRELRIAAIKSIGDHQWGDMSEPEIKDIMIDAFFDGYKLANPDLNISHQQMLRIKYIHGRSFANSFDWDNCCITWYPENGAIQSFIAGYNFIYSDPV